LIATIDLPAIPPSVSGSFDIASQPKAILPSQEAFMAYDMADNSIRDGWYYSLVLDYSMIYLIVDGSVCLGRTIEHALSKSGIVSNTVRKLEITKGFLFDANFPLSLPLLQSLVIFAEVIFSMIPDNAFSGLENLDTVEIKGSRPFSLGTRAFENCLGLRSVILTGLTELIGDFHFSGCLTLSSVAMPSLAIAPKLSSSIFKDCSSLTSLSLGSVQPTTFYRYTFPNPAQISLLLPTGEDYLTYDNSLSISGDKTGDSYWCSIFLPLDYFKVLINDALFEGTTLSDAVSNSNIEPSDITTIDILEGILRIQDIPDVGSLYTSLISFRTGAKVSIIGNLGTSFHQSTIRSIFMQTLTEISNNAFENCMFLTDASFPAVTSVADSAFKGCKSLTSISLPKVTVLLGDSHFEDCERLANLDLRSLSIVTSTSSSIFRGIQSALTLTFPSSPPQTFHFESFAEISVVLSLPSFAAYGTYDTSTLVENDVIGDFRWCGIPLVQLYIEGVIDGHDIKTATLESACASIGVSAASVASITVSGGCLQASQMESLSTRFPALQRFTVLANVLVELNEIPVNAFSGATSLVMIDFRVTVAIRDSAFEGCSSLSDVSFINVPSVGARAFYGTALTSISLPHCRRFVGDSIFEGCASLTSVILQSLVELNSYSANIFAGCTSLASISLPSSPPQTFHPDTFADCLSASLELPSAQAYLTYDTSAIISGDVADDQKWCGLSIPEDRFPQKVFFKANSGFTKSARTLAYGLSQVDGPITSLELEKGVVSSADFLESSVMLSELESLEIKPGTLSVLEDSVLSGHQKLKKLIVSGDIQIKGHALQGIVSLTTLDLPDVKDLPGSALSGCTDLESIDLRSVEAIQAGTFAGLTSLTEAIVLNARFLYGEAFAGCTSLTSISLPFVFELFGDGHFRGCENLESIILLHLAFVNSDSSDIFADCHSLSSLMLWTTPPERFHENIFTNRQSSLPMSITLPSIESWRNYIPQSVTLDGRLYWYGVPHPSDEQPGTESPTELEIDTPSESSIDSPSESPIDSPSESLIDSPSESPIDTPSESPIDTPSKSPIGSPAKSPIASPAKSPIGTVPQSPADTPMPSAFATLQASPIETLAQSMMNDAGADDSLDRPDNSGVLLPLTIVGFVLFGATAVLAFSLWWKMKQHKAPYSPSEEMGTTSL
jgi:hypothetical protein